MQCNKEQRSVWQQILRYTLAVAMLSLYLSGNTAPVGGRIIDDITAHTDNTTTHITFKFTIPVHYQWHFPRTPSKEIMVSLLPVRGGLDGDTRFREHISVPDELKDIIDEIQFDGTEGRNLLLIIHTKNQIKPEIKQGKSASAIIFSVSTVQPQQKSDIECESRNAGGK